jgi:asparagine synthase (glutamine-hydrolysing)
MCGILAIIGNVLPVSSELANKALDTLTLRGPDDRGVWCVDGAWLGHRRLSIIDTSDAGHQPMVDEATGVALTFNGEIYNYIELKNELEALGSKFHSHSDTEVLLQAYLVWGKECVKKFNGDWAFLIWDPRTSAAFFSRDRFAVKPLFYTRIKGVLTVASEPKALLELYPELRKVNEKTLFRFLKETALYDSEDSFYEGISLLLPAHSAEYKTDGDCLSIERYWDWPDDDVPLSGDVQAQFDQLFDDAISLRMRSDVPVGVTLSGGLDSTAILTGAEKQLEHDSLRMKAFTSVYYRKSVGPDIDERKWATLAAENCRQFDLQMVTAPEDLWLQTLSKITWHMDGPGYSPAVFPLWTIMETSSSQKVVVLLEGQGADELLGGYSDYAIIDLIENFTKLAGHLDFRSLIRDVRAYVGSFGLKFFLKRSLRKLSPYLRELNFRYTGVLGVMRKDFIGRAEHNPAVALKPQNTCSVSALEGELRADFTARELPGLLQYGDSISMANSVESRLPFLDYRLVDFCSKLPAKWKIRNGETKYILREYLRRNGQNKIADRKDKKGYPTPLARFLRESDGAILRDMLLNPETRIHAYCDQEKLQKLINRYLAGNNQSENSLYRLLSTELWLRQCIPE